MDNKCSFRGCRQIAVFRLHHLWGKGGHTQCCEEHAPEWAKDGQPPVWMKRTHYRVERLTVDA